MKTVQQNPMDVFRKESLAAAAAFRAGVRGLDLVGFIPGTVDGGKNKGSGLL